MIPLTIGTSADAPDRPAVIDGSRFNRHTFWCGQSGSGKTYALGVVLEQLLLETTLPVAVLDPNADFARLHRLRDEVEPELRERFGGIDIRVFHSSTREEPQLHARYIDLSVRSQAAVGRLDPIVDEEEYNALLHLDKSPGQHFDKQRFLDALATSDDPARRRLGIRIDNLEILGEGGRSLSKEWATEGMQTHLGITVAGFPNLFFLLGPNTGLGHNSVVFMIESQIRYIRQAIDLVRANDARAIVPRAEVQEQFNAKIQRKLRKGVWTKGGCTSWYLDAKGVNRTVWPGFAWRYWLTTRKLRPADFELNA